MPGKDRLLEIVKTETDRAKQHAQNIDVAARHPGGATEATVGDCARAAHAAIDTAADAAKILVREGAQP